MGGVTVLDYAPRARGRRWHMTLGEWVLVCVILAVIGVVVTPKFTAHGDPSRHMLTRQDLARLQIVLAAFERDNGRYPTAEEGLAALFQRPEGLPGWRGPYVARPVFNDPWGTPYVYAAPAEGSPDPVVTSAGPDGEAGTGDDVATGP